MTMQRFKTLPGTRMRMTTVHISRTFAALAAAAVGHAGAATTTAYAYASVQGYDAVSQSDSADNESAFAAAVRDGLLGEGEVFVNAGASSVAGSLRASASSRGITTGSPATDIGATASATWSDSFIIRAPGYGSSDTGTWTGSVQVDGGMLTSFGGRAHVTTYVSAGVDIFPGTGFNGGRTVVSDFAQVDLGYETSRRLGNPSDALTLTFTVPFTYDRPISITMALSAGASARLLGGVVPLIADGAGVATSDYANTMHWLGMSEVRDSSNQLVTDFSAVSTTSDFDFEVSAVPEPDQALLLLAGLAGIVGMRRYASDAQGDTAAAL